MREFKRIYSGPTYARQLVKRAKKAGVRLCLNVTVVALKPHGELELSTPDGLHTLYASRVVIATGVRETPRASRLVSGQRPLGILTTGALQSTVYLQGKAPCQRPVIIGTELVAFSALLTCRHAKIRPVAMLEAGSRIRARQGTQWLATLLAVPLQLDTQLIEIEGKQRVSGVKVQDANGKQKQIECDGVVFCGQFVAESSLLRISHLDFDPQTGNPIIDQFSRCSDPHYFATGNITHPVETAGQCWQDGILCAQQVYASLTGMLAQYKRSIEIVLSHPTIKYATPQRLALSEKNTRQLIVDEEFDEQDDVPVIAKTAMKQLNLRFKQATKGRLSLQLDTQTLSKKNLDVLPERRVELHLPDLDESHLSASLELIFDESG